MSTDVTGKKRKRSQEVKADTQKAKKVKSTEVDAVPPGPDFASLDDQNSTTERLRKKSTTKSNAQLRRLVARAIARGEEPPDLDSLKASAAAKKEEEAASSRQQEEQQEYEEAEGEEGEEGQEEDSKKVRFIAFIGNLPFAATQESVAEHFKSIKPDSIRLPVHPGGKDAKRTKATKPGMAKGYAFIEFSSYDRMKSCLKLYHHSLFPDGKNKPRKINVELTAGGGGSSAQRLARIKEKNEKLAEERTRRKVEADKAAARAEKKGGSKGAADVAEEEEPQPDANTGMHPARRAMLEHRGR